MSLRGVPLNHAQRGADRIRTGGRGFSTSYLYVNRGAA